MNLYEKLLGRKGVSTPTYFLLPKLRHTGTEINNLLLIFVLVEINVLILGLVFLTRTQQQEREFSTASSGWEAVICAEVR